MVIKASEMKKIIKGNNKQGSKEFIVAFDEAVRKLLTKICVESENKRLKPDNIQI